MKRKPTITERSALYFVVNRKGGATQQMNLGDMLAGLRQGLKGRGRVTWQRLPNLGKDIIQVSVTGPKGTVVTSFGFVNPILAASYRKHLDASDTDAALSIHVAPTAEPPAPPACPLRVYDEYEKDLDGRA